MAIGMKESLKIAATGIAFFVTAGLIAGAWAKLEKSAARDQQQLIDRSYNAGRFNEWRCANRAAEIAPQACEAHRAAIGHDPETHW